jgi:hypothetical protein
VFSESTETCANLTTEVSSTQEVELLEHRGVQIRLTHAGLEWIAAVSQPEQRPTMTMTPDRKAAIEGQ